LTRQRRLAATPPPITPAAAMILPAPRRFSLIFFIFHTLHARHAAMISLRAKFDALFSRLLRDASFVSMPLFRRHATPFTMSRFR
jgi:hypothetical protein